MCADSFLSIIRRLSVSLRQLGLEQFVVARTDVSLRRNCLERFVALKELALQSLQLLRSETSGGRRGEGLFGRGGKGVRLFLYSWGEKLGCGVDLCGEEALFLLYWALRDDLSHHY